MTRRRLRIRLDLARRKRASVLLLLGVIFLINGWVIIDTAARVGRTKLTSRIYSAHLDVASMTVWGWVFLGVGALAVIAALVPRLPAWIGFAGLQALATAWALLYAASYFQAHYGRTWLGVLQWGAIAGVLIIISDWDDPPAHRATRETSYGD